MHTDARPADQLLDVARVLLLLQGAILVATTIEALLWGALFMGAAGAPFLMSAAAAAVVLIGRVRLRADRRRTRRLIYVVEGLVLATFVVNTTLAIALAGALPPAAAVLTQLALPLSVVLLLRGWTRAASRPMPVSSGGLEASS